jgi:site-specific DNA-methyltransferase (adenine-specific)
LLTTYIAWATENGYSWELLFWHKSNPMPYKMNTYLKDTEYMVRIYATGATFNNDLEYNHYKTYFLESTQHNNGHPTPKPIKTIVTPIVISSKPGDIILDPFMGSGTTAVAAIETGRQFIGFELSQEYCQIAEKRIAKAMLQKPLDFNCQQQPATQVNQQNKTFATLAARARRQPSQRELGELGIRE